MLRRSPRFAALTVLALVPVLAACGSKAGKATSSDASTPDGAVDQTPDATAPASGGGTLSGPQAFPIGSALMSASVGGKNPGCNDQTIPTGLIPAVSIALLPTDVTAAAACGDAGPPAGDAGSAVFLGVATTEWATTMPITESLAPGTYTISNEHQDDEDLCMLVAPGTAFLLVSPLGGESTALAVSGTVTLTGVSATAVAGSFQVVLGGPYGMDAAAPQALSGSFHAVACP